MQRVDRFFARGVERGALVGGEIAGDGHQARREERIDGARGIDGQLREEANRILQIALGLLDHGRHRFEPRGGGERARFAGA